MSTESESPSINISVRYRRMEEPQDGGAYHDYPAEEFESASRGAEEFARHLLTIPGHDIGASVGGVRVRERDADGITFEVRLDGIAYDTEIYPATLGQYSLAV